MRYTGEARIRLSGDKDVAVQFIPFARTLLGALSVRDAESGGLPQSILRRTLGGGRVSIEVGFSYGQYHISIDVRPLVSQQELPGIFGVYALFPLPYYLFPVATDIPAPKKPAKSKHAAALFLQKEKLHVEPERELVRRGFSRFDEPEELAGSHLDWVSADGMRFYMRVWHPTTELIHGSYISKYCFEKDDDHVNAGIFWRNHLVREVDRITGFGILDGWLVICRHDLENPSKYGFYTTKVSFADGAPDASGVAYPMSDEDAYTISSSTYVGESGWSSSLVHGSHWLIFSPAGDRAVRARVFEKELSPKTYEYRAYKEEFVFEMDTSLSEPRPKIVSHQITFVNSIRGELTDTVLTNTYTNSQNHHLHTIQEVEYTGTRLLVACDYTTSGEPATLTLVINKALWNYEYENKEEYAIPDPIGYAPSGPNYDDPDFSWEFESAGSSYWNRRKNTTTTFETEISLVYEGGSHFLSMPLHSNEGSAVAENKSYETGLDTTALGLNHARGDFTATATSKQTEYTPSPWSPYKPIYTDYDTEVVGTSSADRRRGGDITATMTGMPRFAEAGIGPFPCMDLRNGVFVSSRTEVSYSCAGELVKNGTQVETIGRRGRTKGGGFIPTVTIFDDGRHKVVTTGDGLDSIPGTTYPAIENYEYERVDTLYIANDDTRVDGLNLPRVRGTNTLNRPRYEDVSSRAINLDAAPMDSFYLRPAYLPKFLGAMSVEDLSIRSVGGSVAVQPGEGVLFSVMGRDYYKDPLFPPDPIYPIAKGLFCKQATYLYSFKNSVLYTLTPELWDSVKLVQQDDEDTYRFGYGQVGVVEWVGGGA